MGFDWVNVGLTAGAAFVAVPIILHLILRQKPKHQIFPALRLVQVRHQKSVKKLRIRHWLLLAMRMLLVALMAFALARPSLHGASFIPDQQAPVAAALIFDTSMSMEYRREDRSRLAIAKEIADELILEFAEGSEVLVLDSAEPFAHFFPDTGLAQSRVESLEQRPLGSALNRSIQEAYRAIVDSDRAHKEVFIFTDRTKSSFDLDAATELSELIESNKDKIALYVVDVGIPDPVNSYIQSVRLSGDVIPSTSELRIEVDVVDEGVKAESAIEFLMDGETRGSRPLPFDQSDTARIEFSLRGLSPGVHQGKLVIRNGGGLEFDDTYFITVEARTPSRILIVSDIAVDASNIQRALAPPKLVALQRAPFEVSWIDTPGFSKIRLDDYAALCLVNVAELSGGDWQRVDGFIQSGGGVAVFLGNRTMPDNYNQTAAQRVLPARIGSVKFNEEPLFLNPLVAQHPSIVRLNQWRSDALSEILVERYAGVEPTEGICRVLVEYSDTAAALIERVPEQQTAEGSQSVGAVMVLTTGINPTRPGESWNDLAQSSIPFVILTHGMATYLSGIGDQRLNYQAGEDIAIRPFRGESIGSYQYLSPDSDQPSRRSLGPRDHSYLISGPEQIGHYDILPSEESNPPKGFSVNASRAESSMIALTAQELDTALGPENYSVVKSLDELKDVMGDVRIGRELFPFIIVLIFVLFTLEHFLANRFYRAESSEPAEPKREFRRRKSVV